MNGFSRLLPHFCGDCVFVKNRFGCACLCVSNIIVRVLSFFGGIIGKKSESGEKCAALRPDDQMKIG